MKANQNHPCKNSRETLSVIANLYACFIPIISRYCYIVNQTVLKQIENKKMDLLQINHEEILAGINLVDLDGFG